MIGKRGSAIAVTVLLLAGTAGAQETTVTKPETAARAFVALLASGDFTAAETKLDTTMQRLLPAARLAETWAGVQAQAGAFRAQHGVSVTHAGRYTVAAVTCEFARASLDVQVAYDPAGLVAGLHMVPTPTPWEAAAYVTPSAFRVEDATVGTGALALPGTLTIPAGAGPFPAVVLVHGSGPNDRDESVGGAKPFRDLAEGLSSRGIAVLRYEKRSRAHPASFTGRFTVDQETVDDAVAAAELLRGRKEIDPGRVFVLGHSLGGMMAPRIGQRDPRLAGLIILAGTTRPLEDVITEQTAYLARAAGADSEQARPQLDALRAGAAAVRALSPADSASLTPVMGAPASYWLDLRGYRPAEVAATLRLPMLVLQGERDYQVTMTDFAAWKRALGGRPDVELRTYPALNHLFVAGSGPSVPAEYAARGHVDSSVINDIAGWISRARPAPHP
jgi:dienelactone hydrolase